MALCVYVSLSVKGRHPLAAWRPTAGETVSVLWIGHLYVSYVDRSSFYAKLFNLTFVTLIVDWSLLSLITYRVLN